MSRNLVFVSHCDFHNRDYGFGCFDGLNRLHGAENITELVERLAAAPIVFYEFVRWSEWSDGPKAATLEQELARRRDTEVNRKQRK